MCDVDCQRYSMFCVAAGQMELGVGGEGVWGGVLVVLFHFSFVLLNKTVVLK